jgi:hypothetical protein
MQKLNSAPSRHVYSGTRQKGKQLCSHVVCNLGIISFGIFSYTLHIKFIENLPTATNEKKKKYKINM